MSESIVRDLAPERNTTPCARAYGRPDDDALSAAHRDIAAMTPTATAELILALTVDVGGLAPADVARLRLAAIRLAGEIAVVRR